MTPGPRGRRHRTVAALAAGLTLCVAGGGAVIVASASSLGLTSRKLDAWTAALVANAPTVIACDNFEGLDGSLSARAVTDAATCGSFTWTVHGGTWSTVSSQAIADGTPGATATLAAGAADAVVTANVSGADTASRTGGLVVAHDGAADYLAAVLVGDVTGHVDLIAVDGGAEAVLATGNLTIGSSVELSIARDGAQVTVRVDGAVLVTHTLDAGTLAALGAGSGAGLYASSADVQMDDFRVTTIPT